MEQAVQMGFRPVKATVDIDKIIECNVAAPSKGMVKSVAKFGVLSPVILQKNGEGYKIIAGRRRVSAAKANKETEIDALVIDDLTLEQGAMIALTENMQRQPNPLVEADLMKVLVDTGKTQKEIAAELCVSQPQVAQRLKLLNLCEEARTRVEDAEITVSIARKMAELPHERQRELIDLMDSRETKLTERDINNAKREGKLEDVLNELPTPINKVDVVRSHIENIRQSFTELEKPEQTALRKEVMALCEAIGIKMVKKAKATKKGGKTALKKTKTPKNGKAPEPVQADAQTEEGVPA